MDQILNPGFAGCCH